MNTQPEQLRRFIEKKLEKMIDNIIEHEPEKIKSYVDSIKVKYYGLSKNQIAKKILNDQSQWSGMLGAMTGLGGLITLPATVPFDLVKYLRIQAFMVCSLAYLYDIPLSDLDNLKTDIFLIMAHSSIEKLKECVCSEADKNIKNDAFKRETLQQLKRMKSYKDIAIKFSTEKFSDVGVKYATRIAVNLGGKTVMNSTLKRVPKIFRGLIWRIGGRKIAERTMQKTISKAVPVIGAAVGGGVDWWMTRSVGEVAIEYYEMNGPGFIQCAFSLVDE